jgi:hypothetical protein
MLTVMVSELQRHMTNVLNMKIWSDLTGKYNPTQWRVKWHKTTATIQIHQQLAGVNFHPCCTHLNIPTKEYNTTTRWFASGFRPNPKSLYWRFAEIHVATQWPYSVTLHSTFGGRWPERMRSSQSFTPMSRFSLAYSYHESWYTVLLCPPKPDVAV